MGADVPELVQLHASANLEDGAPGEIYECRGRVDVGWGIGSDAV
jgi:hypothetical protein